MDTLDIGLVSAVITVLLAIIARTELRERRIQKMASDIEYMRRDVDQLLSLFRLIPIEIRERRRRQ